ncbi:N-6 DNA methylase [Rhodococcus erythropolis]|uniref:N-6 DNA methylase n=1 Tax=Rhodococcus erythropolis TaxID=1833 RepID=UPI000B1CB1E8
MSIDQYYTPEWLAKTIAELVPDGLSGPVFDPSAGEGALLRFVDQRFGGDVSIIGADINPKSVQLMTKEFPEWIVGRADALNVRSRNASSVWRRVREERVGIVVLNPPFSYRGGSGIWVEYKNFRGRLSPAAAFVALMLTEVDPVHGVLAVLPKGVINGIRCQDFWREVREDFNFELQQDLYSGTFAGARANASVVFIRPKEDIGGRSIAKNDSTSVPPKRRGCKCVEIIRGRVPRHLRWPESECTETYLHTTNFDDATSFSDRLAPARLASHGASIILSRVGNPKPVKLSMSPSGSYVLSDCLYALRPVAVEGLTRLHDSILSNSSTLANSYFGTGAPHLPLPHLVKFLREIGFVPHHVRASSDIGFCRCSAKVRAAA